VSPSFVLRNPHPHVRWPLASLAIKRRSHAVLAALSTVLLGVVLEFRSEANTGRSFDVRDIFINGAGGRT
jgi:hypothetical protein